MRTTSAVHSDPEIMGGTPVFIGTRVPFQTLIDYLEDGLTLAAFRDDFPTVTREQAIAALEHRLESDPRFLVRIDIARQCVDSGRGIALEDLP